MSDHIAAVRAQAEKEALRINRIHRENLGDNEMFDSAYALGFVNGSMWLASRLTREKIAIALAKRKSRDWDSMSGALHVAAIHAEYPNADAILALLTEDLRAVDQ